MRPLYVVGTDRNVGKTTFCLGLITNLRKRGLSVGYIKPLGQRYKVADGRPIHDDALVVSRALGLEAESANMVLPLGHGRVEQEVFDLHTPELAEKITASVDSLRNRHDLVVIEGMGHVAMGSCLKMSAADVARVVGARTLLIGGGGIGRAIDAIALCATFLETKNADLAGVVINKVWPAKYKRVKEAVTQGLENLGIRSFGTVPYEPVLSAPTVRQVADQLNAEVLCGEASLSNRVETTVIAAMESDHMVTYLRERALVITPGDRADNILAVLSTYVLDKRQRHPVSGLVLTGGFRPTGTLMTLLADSAIPTLLCQEDTYTLAGKLSELIFKITPDDQTRIQQAVCTVGEYVDVDAILKALAE